MSAPVLFQALPPLSPDEYAALEQSIKEYGVQSPIVVDEAGVVIDGHHRQKIAEGLGIICPRIVRDDLDGTAKRSLALSMNIDRRHLTREQRRTLVEASVRADPQLSNRQHAARTGVDHKTVAAVRAPLEATGELPQSAVRISADGRERPSSQPPREVVDTATGELNAPTHEGAHHDDGRDQHQRSAPTPSRTTAQREALTTTTRNLGLDLGRISRRVEKVAEDDRLRRNADLARTHLGYEASNALVAITKLLDQFGADRLATNEEARSRWATDLLTAAEALTRLGQSLQGDL